MYNDNARAPTHAGTAVCAAICNDDSTVIKWLEYLAERGHGVATLRLDTDYVAPPRPNPEAAVG
ncbi:hypothetical protein IA54_014115 [Xanthomonas phaseoli pv. syngonii LMG 9055]|uniref:Uncharacterized protein n=1 Tax=Xanthomonas phaseoli pv. syngonii LMG 9055 TaxID=1437878 RepID=A0A1V9GRN4_9XANT|nr:hypothetical protein IA54_014115 [Xanthomonas phaseoli pv. syngonii LMG 9055]